VDTTNGRTLIHYAVEQLDERLLEVINCIHSYTGVRTFGHRIVGHQKNGQLGTKI
jgi:hypothetical protein